MIVLPDRILLFRLELKENVAGKQWLLEHNRLAAILVRRTVARQRYRDSLPLAVFRELLLSSRPGMRDKPTQLGHAAEDSVGRL